MSRCPWCGRPFAARHGGREQRFCGPCCRRAYHDTARAWALAELTAGRLTVDAIRHPVPATRALDRRASEQASLPPPDPAFMAALRARGSMRPTVPIGPEGIAQLVVLGWLPRRYCHDPATVVDAIVRLADAALAARLRP
jgi:hypothetical protein